MSEETFGREPVVYVQIDQDFCNLTYGEAPCNAQVGVTGQRKCFNTRRTCQDTDNYDRGNLTLTFTKRTEDIDLDGLYVIPSLNSVSTVPTEINPGGNSADSGALGSRASVTVKFVDHPHSDIAVDKYRTERDYIATERGTFWSKWIARNPYYINRELRIYEGYRGQSLSEMRQRTYVIDTIEGPGSSGEVSIKAKDVLKLADDDTAQAPRPSQGELESDIDESSNEIIISRFQSEDDYPANGGIVVINDELIRYSNASYDANFCTLTGLSRGAEGTEADTHDEEDRVQLCLEYDQKRVDDIIFELLTDYGSVPANYINRNDWAAEYDVWLNQYSLSTIIAEPTGVTTLVGELSEQCIFSLWWDERFRQVRLEAIKPASDAPVLFNDNQNFIAGSTALKAKAKERISQIWFFYGLRDPTERTDSEQNFSRIYIRADAAAESANEYGDQKIRKVFSRWLSTEAQVINASARLLSRFRDVPRYLNVNVDAKDRESWTGDVVDVETRAVVDETGATQRSRWQIISAEESELGHQMEYKLQVYEYGIGDKFGAWMENDAPDYSDATDTEKAEGGWWANNQGTLGENEDEPYRWA